MTNPTVWFVDRAIRKFYRLRKKTQISHRVYECRQCGAAVDNRTDGWVVNAKNEVLCSLSCFDTRWRLSEKMAKGELSWEDLSGLRMK